MTIEEKFQQLEAAVLAAGASRSLLQAYTTAYTILVVKELRKDREAMIDGLRQDTLRIGHELDQLAAELTNNHWGGGM
jgi:hypothetical protein